MMPLLRRSCVVCGRAGEPLCRVCNRRLTPAPSTRVRGVGRVPALFAYEGVGAAAVQALKFRDGRRLITPFADAIATQVVALPDLVCTWLPTSTHRRRQRGFDQSELLARAIARRLDRPVAPVLHRLPGSSQVGRTRDQRDRNVTFVARRPRLPGRCGPLLVVDDVCTTGATIRAAAATLDALDITDRTYFVVARTP